MIRLEKMLRSVPDHVHLGPNLSGDRDSAVTKKPHAIASKLHGKAAVKLLPTDELNYDYQSMCDSVLCAILARTHADGLILERCSGSYVLFSQIIFVYEMCTFRVDLGDTMLRLIMMPL